MCIEGFYSLKTSVILLYELHLSQVYFYNIIPTVILIIDQRTVRVIETLTLSTKKLCNVKSMTNVLLMYFL